MEICHSINFSVEESQFNAGHIQICNSDVQGTIKMHTFSMRIIHGDAVITCYSGISEK